MKFNFKRRVLASLLLPALSMPLAALAGNDRAAQANPDSRTVAPMQDRHAAGATFDRLDTNRDGRLSQNEARRDNRISGMWNQLDADRDGMVTRAEFDRHPDAMAGSVAYGNDRNAHASQSGAGVDIRANRIIGTHVRNPQGQDLGEIEDLVVDTASGKVRYAVLSFGGFLDIGDKLFAFPLSEFSRSAQGGELVLDVDRQRLQSMPGFDRGGWLDWNDRATLSRVDRNFTPQSRASQGSKASSRDLVSARRLMGRDVHERGGEEIGEIEDLLVNLDSGNVRYAVFEYDKPWSLASPRFAVPLDAFDFSDRGTTRLKMDRARFERMASEGSRDTTARQHAGVEHYAVILVPADAANAPDDGAQASGTVSATGNARTNAGAASGNQAVRTMDDRGTDSRTSATR